MKESSNTTVSSNTSKNELPMQDMHEQEIPRQEVHKQPVFLTQQVIDFLKVRYDFRYNLLTEETEFRPSGQRDISFCRIDKRELNTFCLEAHKEVSTAGIKTSKIYLLYPSEKLPPFPALHERTTCMGRNRTVKAFSKTSIRRSVMDKKFPHLDARTCRPMAGNESSTSQQRSPDTYQRRAGTP